LATGRACGTAGGSETASRRANHIPVLPQRNAQDDAVYRRMRKGGKMSRLSKCKTPGASLEIRRRLHLGVFGLVGHALVVARVVVRGRWLREAPAARQIANRRISGDTVESAATGIELPKSDCKKPNQNADLTFNLLESLPLFRSVLFRPFPSKPVPECRVTAT
jgi:hypothetical protein